LYRLISIIFFLFFKILTGFIIFLLAAMEDMEKRLALNIAKLHFPDLLLIKMRKIVDRKG